MIGLEWPRPGMGVFQRMFSEVWTFQVVGVSSDGASPLAKGPRKEGQLVSAPERGEEQKTKRARERMNRMNSDIAIGPKGQSEGLGSKPGAFELLSVVY